MSKQKPVYARRRTLRAVEKGWTYLEAQVDRLTTAAPKLAPYNPLYHLGTLAVYLLIVLTITGLYITLFYRPGADRAYASVIGISATWLGSLMRTAHRYASDALIVVAFLHALKTFLSERFWGSRWLAWISGWVMLAIIWAMGLMGYWLVWDGMAQWLTEYFVGIIGGPFAHSILAGNLASSTYALFVIILFLHVFIPPFILVGVLIHVLRLARSRYLPPRWIMITSVIVLALLAIIRPVTSIAPADFTQLVDNIKIDWLYLGFLPLVDIVGAPLFWGVSLFFLAIAFILPWAWKGQHEGPSIVIDANCTGCSACARECPFDAIEMVLRDDETEFESLAVVNENKCTGCGICVGACHDDAIELDRLHSAVIRQDIHRTLHRAGLEGEAPITVYVCDRHKSMGTLPPFAKPESLDTVSIGIGGSIPLMQAKLPPRINVGTWADSDNKPHPVVTAVVPCTGMLHPNWVAETVEAGGAGAIVVSCPSDDCAFREGPHWVADRLKRRRTFRKGTTHFIEAAPGSRDEVTGLWAMMVGDEAQAEKSRHATSVIGSGGKQAIADETPTAVGQLRYFVTGFLLLLFLFFVSILIELPASNSLPEQGQIRLVMNHGGQLLAQAEDLPPEIASKLPDNIDPSMVLGGERFPILLRVVVDGETMLEETYEASGLRKEGSVFAQEAIWLAPGEYDVKILMNDNGSEWLPVYSDKITIPDGGVSRLLFDDIEGRFILR